MIKFITKILIFFQLADVLWNLFSIPLPGLRPNFREFLSVILPFEKYTDSQICVHRRWATNSVGQLRSKKKTWDSTPGQQVLFIPKPPSTSIVSIHSYALPSLLYFPYHIYLLLPLTHLIEISFDQSCMSNTFYRSS